LPRQQIPRGGLQDVLRHPGLAGVDAARLGLADIVLEPLPTLIRDRAQDDDGPVIVDLDMLAAFGHVPRLPAGAVHRQWGRHGRRQRSKILRRA
jgi:hypothetical protein